jgi:hypothetical protein
MAELPSEAEFRAYEKVRAGGRWNMWDRLARRATGLEEDRYSAVLNSYDALMLKYPGVREEN